MHEIVIERPFSDGVELEAVLRRHADLGYSTIHYSIAQGMGAAFLALRGGPASLAAFAREYVEDPPRQIVAAEVVAQDNDGAEVYELERSDVHPTDISGLVSRHLGPLALTHVDAGAGRLEWTIRVPSAEGVRAFTGALAEQGERLRRSFDRTLEWYAVKRVGRPRARTPPRPTLTPEEDRALRRAIELGFYRRPRGIDISRLADALGVPRSTAHYRLRSAQEKVLSAYLPPEP